MSATQTPTHEQQRFTKYGVAVDRHAFVMAILFLVVTTAAVYIAVQLTAAGETVETPGDVEGAGAGAGWALLEVAFAGVLILLIALYERFPEWVQELVRWNIALAMALYLGHGYGQSGVSLVGTLVIPMLILTGWKILEETGLWWLGNNVLALFMAIVAGAGLGMALNPTALFVALVILTIYDHLFADKQDWMFSLLAVMVKARVPVLFIWPARLRFDWEDAFEIGDEADDNDSEDVVDEELESEDIGWGLGMADLMIPAAFAAAVAVRSPPPLTNETYVVLAGVIAGLLVASLRLRYKMETHGSGAGLPAITAGIVGGYIVAWPFAMAAAGTIPI